MRCPFRGHLLTSSGHPEPAFVGEGPRGSAPKVAVRSFFPVANRNVCQSQVIWFESLRMASCGRYRRLLPSRCDRRMTALYESYGSEEPRRAFGILLLGHRRGPLGQSLRRPVPPGGGQRPAQAGSRYSAQAHDCRALASPGTLHRLKSLRFALDKLHLISRRELHHPPAVLRVAERSKYLICARGNPGWSI